MTNKPDPMLAAERAVFDALTAISYCLGCGMIGSVSLRTGPTLSVVGLLPKNPADNAAMAERFPCETLMDAFILAGQRCDTQIHRAMQDGADVQSYLHAKDAIQKGRRVPVIVLPN